MAEIRWARQAERAASRLPLDALLRLEHMLDLISANPEMYVGVTTGRYRGSRRASIRPHWMLYYRVRGPERACELITIRDTRRQPV